MIEVYKIVHDIYDPITTKKLLTKISASSITRRINSIKLFKKGTKKDKYKHFFTNRIINVWNNLPDPVVTAKSLNIFKNKVDTHFRDYKYSIEGEIDALFQFP